MSAQPVQALERANEVKQRRAQFKRDMKAGTTRMSTLLREGIPDWLATTDAERLLLMAPRVGHRAAFSLLREARLGPAQEARHITERQRLLLADQLEHIENLRSTHREAAA